MQVSWIDADEVRDLVALLAEPPPRSASGAPDLNTLPETADRFGFEFVAEKPAAAPWQPTSELPATPAPVTFPPAAPSPAPNFSPAEAGLQPDLSHIREKLRLIRDRAQEAGLLTKEAPEQKAAPPQSPSPAPVAVQPPSPPPAAALPSPSVPLPNLAPPEDNRDATTHVETSAVPDSATQDRGTIVERLDDFAQWSAKQTLSEELFMLDDHGDLLWGAPTSDDLLVCAKLAMNASLRSQAATLSKPAGPTRVQVGPGKELQLVSCSTRHGTVTIALVNPQQVPSASLRDALAMALDR